MQTTTGALVPPRRLGSLLRQARLDAGLTLEQIALPTGLTVVELDDIEQGRRRIDDKLVRHLVMAYGIDNAALVPPRSQLVIDLDEGRIAVNQTDIATDGMVGADAVLTRYLALVYHLRGLPLGARIHLRDVDLDVLAEALQLEVGDIEHRLHDLMIEEDSVERDQRRIRRRMLLPLVGIVIASGAAGTLLLVADNEAPAPDPAATMVETETSTDGLGGGLDPAATVETRIGNGGAVAEAKPMTTDLGTAAVLENNG